jgi:3-phenylpropionate/trans-cinnamate dioxygenase ferredoxin reductase component
MATYRYLIIGGGMTGDAAVKGIRERDPEGSVVLVGEEQHPPYARPPLTKALWKGKDEDSIWRGTEELIVDLRLGRRIVSLNPDAHTATDDQGETYGYERALLATGGVPRRLPDAPEGVIYYRTLDDYRRLRGQTAGGGSAVVIGSGFIGSEIAAALAINGTKVTMVFPHEAIGSRLFPAELARSLNDYYAEQGVDLVPGETVAAVARDGDRFAVTTESGRTVNGDVVVAGLGIEPRTELAEAAGLDVDNGIVVDDRGRAGGREDLFAAGDAAQFPAKALGTSLRVEHEDNANSQGRQVGANMAGADEPYDHLPFFYSDLFDLGYEAVGEVDSRLRTVEAWAEPNRKGVVQYVDDEGRPRGFLLWDVWGKVDDATALIRAGEPVDEAKLRELMG